MAVIQKLGLEAFEFLKNLVSKAGQDVNNLPDAPSGDFGALKDLPFGMVKKEGIPKTVRVTNPFTGESTIEKRIKRTVREAKKEAWDEYLKTLLSNYHRHLSCG